MTEALEPKPGHKILEIGSGSGYQAAILARCVGSKGKIITVELEAKLVEYQDMRTNLMQDKSRLENEERRFKAKIQQLERQLEEIEVLKQKNMQVEEDNMMLKSKVKRLTLELESLK